MKKKYYLVCSIVFLLVGNCLQAHADPLDELAVHGSLFYFEIDTEVVQACRMLIDEWRMCGYCYTNVDLDEFIHAENEVDIETALKALHFCLHYDVPIKTERDSCLRNTLKQAYRNLRVRYREIVEKTGSRRIKIKFYNKITTNEFISNKSAHVQDLSIEKNLRLGSLSGALVATNGQVSTGLIPTQAIPDNAITQSKISSNPPAVTTVNIAPMSITPALLAFNTVQTFADEPNPLRIYRGSVTGSTGASTGSGFTVTRTVAGAYTIDITGPAYTDNTSYQVFIQLFNETDPITLVQVSGSQFTVQTVVDHDFSFFTIGN